MKSKTHPYQWCYTLRQPLRWCWAGVGGWLLCGWEGLQGGRGRVQRLFPGWPGDKPLWVSQGPALVISVSALQFGLLRLGQKATDSIQIQNVSQLLATWCMKESLVCLQERGEDVSRVPTSSRAAYPPPPPCCWQLNVLAHSEH